MEAGQGLQPGASLQAGEIQAGSAALDGQEGASRLVLHAVELQGAWRGFNLVSSFEGRRSSSLGRLGGLRSPRTAAAGAQACLCS